VSRVRADILLVDRGFFSSREQARAAILAGEVRADDTRIAKAGELIDGGARIEVAERKRYVSRGGDKLAGALDAFGVDPAGLRAADVGASTGGFTDCLLQRGAVSVCAVDVGYGQLAWTLRQDPRVDVHERTNIRTADAADLGAPFDLVVVDVSFISLATVLPHLRVLMGESGQLVALVKPQFEAGKGRVGKRGVVRDPAVHVDVLRGVVRVLGAEGLVVRGLTWSLLKGPEGNIEFLIWAATAGEACAVDPETVVARAHECLGG
jgi:23S rRNA (cytidine1920-2'-O)/16S rRNA (cytidine1409-2'-O)-methyltransferase